MNDLHFFLAKLSLILDMKTNKCLKDKKFRVWVAGIFFSKGQKPKREAYSAPSMYLTVNTVCSRSLDLFYIASYYIKLVKTSLTYNKKNNSINTTLLFNCFDLVIYDQFGIKSTKLLYKLLVYMPVRAPR